VIRRSAAVNDPEICSPTPGFPQVAHWPRVTMTDESVVNVGVTV
jgi:hypothetical protein